MTLHRVVDSIYTSHNVTRLLPVILGVNRLRSAVAPLTRTYSVASIPVAKTKRGVRYELTKEQKELLKLNGDLREMNNPAWTARVLSVPGIDTDLSLYVSFDSARFCFGAGEGTQRAFIQKRTTWRHMQAVFLPDGASGRGGLPG